MKVKQKPALKEQCADVLSAICTCVNSIVDYPAGENTTNTAPVKISETQYLSC